jgi:hypothetical protein
MRSNAEELQVGGECAPPARRPTSGVDPRRKFLRWGSGMFLLAATSGLSRTAFANLPNRPSTSRASRQKAIADIPLARLREPVRSKIQTILVQPTIYRRMPVEVIPCDPELYLFLVRYPEVIVNMWQLMGVTKVAIKRTGAYAYQAEDGAGTVSQVELVYGTRQQHLFLADGYYEGPLLPRRVTGRCVMLLTSAYSTNAESRTYVSNRLDVFVQVDNTGLEIVAKTLHPLMGRTADSNFAESTRFLGQVSQVAETNGQGVQRLVTRLTSIEPQVRDRFAALASAVNQRATLRAMADTKHKPSARLSDRDGDASVDTIIDR